MATLENVHRFFIGLWIAAVTAIVGTCAIWVFTVSCAEQPVQSSASPHGNYSAIVLLRDCGVTSSATYTVRVFPNGAEPTDEHTVLSFKNGVPFTGALESAALVQRAGSRVDFIWRSPDSLELWVETRAKVLGSMLEGHGVAIAHKLRVDL